MGDPAEQERLFMAASRLQGRARKKLLEQAVRETPDLVRAVQAMLEQTERRPETLVRQPTGSFDRAATERSLSRLERISRVLAPRYMATALLVALVGGGLWSWNATKEGLDQLTLEFLEAHLQETLRSVELFVEDRSRGLGLLARDPALCGAVAELVALGDAGAASPEALLASPAYARALDAFEIFADAPDYGGFWLVDGSGRALGATEPEEVGARLSLEGSAVLAPAFAGQQGVYPGLRENLFTGEPFERRVVLFYSPVTGPDGKILAALALAFRPHVHFNRVFREEEFQDALVFDRNGRVLSETIWLSELQRLDMLPEEGGAKAELYLRDPGGDLTRGFRTDVPVASRPLTRMAASALAGESGSDLDGYRNMLGVEVVGAWLWLPRYQIGLAAEVDSHELRRLLRPLLISFSGLALGLLLLSLVTLALSSALRSASRRRAEYQLGEYTLLEKIGEGGMGVVYKARHSMLRRATAVKILRGATQDAESVARFEREVQLTSQLTHPNTVAVYDYGHDQSGVFYYAMEYLEGVSLGKLLEDDGAQPPARVLHILKQVCGSLHEAHEVGLIHRDIKPANIVLCQRGGCSDVVKVLDFGLVKDTSVEGDVHLSSPDVIKGTPLYIAPERIQDSRSADPRTDIYSLGCVAFALLTGTELFDGRTATELITKVLHDPRPRPSERVGAAIPPELDQLVVDCVARDPDQRPASMSELAHALQAIDSVPRWMEEDARAAWPASAGG